MAQNLNSLISDFIIGAKELSPEDRFFMLDQIEQARWEMGATYNRGVHRLLDVVQCLVEKGYAHRRANT